MGRLSLLAFGRVVCLWGPLLCSAQDYNANMTGSAVIPWVESTGFAQLYIRFYRTNDNQSNSAQADYVVNVFNIGGITSVGLYQAPLGSNGALVAWLYGWDGVPDRSKKYGTLRADTITRDKLKGPDHGANVSDLEARINDGDLYCLLTTLDNPKGELRGQVVHPDGFSFSSLPILGPPVAPVPVPVPLVIPTIIAIPSPVPIPAPAPSPSPPPPSTTVVPVVVPVNVSSPASPPSPPPSPSPSPPPSPTVAVVPITVKVPVPAPASPSPSPSPPPSPTVAVVPVTVPVPVPAPASPSPSPSPSPTPVPAVVVPAATSPSPAVTVTG